MGVAMVAIAIIVWAVGRELEAWVEAERTAHSTEQLELPLATRAVAPPKAQAPQAPLALHVVQAVLWVAVMMLIGLAVFAAAVNVLPLIGNP